MSIHATATNPFGDLATLVSAWMNEPGESEITGWLIPPLEELLLTVVLTTLLVVDFELVVPAPPPPPWPPPPVSPGARSPESVERAPQDDSPAITKPIRGRTKANLPSSRIMAPRPWW